ncbi:hypothetical protein CGCSCA4_v008178 [Colletotrichum siamense]|uniref:Uncharacterized protein n=1 Tax=Colletotrichum siamense TaxID=690259 RepID=A0A9P5ETT9_COLSI|nr:hypothetical protein CGCSCA4_v008178 [Colletotrichum siamense]KAF4859181.1 hypothetical protein CGCSCA2_v006682 [Colletotrichum siamense]
MSNERYSSRVGTHLLDVLNAETDKHFHKRRYYRIVLLSDGSLQISIPDDGRRAFLSQTWVLHNDHQLTIPTYFRFAGNACLCAS